jgi:hypothetical protein
MRNNEDRAANDSPRQPQRPGNETENVRGDMGDLQDSASDQERLKQDISYVDMPEVSDLPSNARKGTEGPLSPSADTTISSDDEEGLRNDNDITEDDDLGIVMGTEADVTKEDLAMLGTREEDMDLGDDEDTPISLLDETDSEGEPLNESQKPEDLDIPADTDEDIQELPGSEDEENDYYSLGSDNNDEIVEGTP